MQKILSTGSQEFGLALNSDDVFVFAPFKAISSTAFLNSAKFVFIPLVLLLLFSPSDDANRDEEIVFPIRRCNSQTIVCVKINKFRSRISWWNVADFSVDELLLLLVSMQL